MHSITFPPGTQGIAEVTVGPQKRVFRTTSRAVAVAMLGSQNEDENAAGAAGEVIWSDFLRTHGIAVGSRGPNSYILAVLPAKERTVNYTGPREWDTDSANITVAFPPMLVALHLLKGAFRNAILFCISPGLEKTLQISNTANVGLSFPYGNVYGGTGAICWGSVPHAHIKSIADFEELFFGSNFNGDLYSAGGGRLSSLARGVKKGQMLPLGAANTSIPAIVQRLVAGR